MSASPIADASAFLQREREIAAIDAAIEGAITGAGAVMLVEGPAGIGKTSLLAVGRRSAAARGCSVLVARGAELERDFGFSVVRQLFEQVAARGRALTGAAELAAPALGVHPVSETPAADAGFAVVHGLFWLVADLAGEQPLVLVVDDAHWADAPSLRFLAYLAGRIEGLPLLMLLAARPPDTGTDPIALAELGTDPRTAVLHPGPLDRTSVAAAIGARLGGPPGEEFADAVHRATGGNPFLVVELLAQLRADGVPPEAAAAAAVARTGPPAIARRLLLRLGALPDGSLALARTLAVLGDGAHRRDVCALAELDSAALAPTVDALVGAGLLAAGASLEFAHPVIRRAVYDDISPSVRGDLHARAARLLADRGAAGGEVAAHLLATPPRGDQWALEALRLAATEAGSRGTPDTAATYLRRALAEPPPLARTGELLAELGTVEALAHDRAAVEHLEAAAARLQDPRLRAAVALELGRLTAFAGELDESHRGLVRALEELGEVDRELSFQLQAQLTMTDNIRPVRTRARIAPETLPGTTVGERQLLASLAFSLAMQAQPAERALATAERALAGGDMLVDPSGSPRFMDAVAVLIVGDRSEKALPAIAYAVDEARRRGHVGCYAGALAMRSIAAYRRGEVGEAVADADEALALAASHRMSWLALLALTFLVDAQVERDNLDGAEAALEEHGALGSLPDHLGAHGVYASRGRVRAARGALEEALADLHMAGRRCEATGVASPAFMPWRSHTADVLVRMERYDEASRLAQQELSLARIVGTPHAIGVAARAAGLAARGDAGMALVDEAVCVLAGSPCRLEHARALVDLGGELHRAGRRNAARESLYAGLDAAHRCGAAALENRARELLLRTGARPRRPVLRGVDALTPSELRVAQMAASGMTNRDIAQALFVTLKTVEMHLGHVYPKLGIRGRAGLTAALGDGIAADHARIAFAT